MLVSNIFPFYSQYFQKPFFYWGRVMTGSFGNGLITIRNTPVSVRQKNQAKAFKYLFTKRQNFTHVQIESICKRKITCEPKLKFALERIEYIVGKEKMLDSRIFLLPFHVLKASVLNLS